MNSASKKNLIVFIIIAILAVIGLRAFNSGLAGSHKYDAFAQCIEKSGAKFYGAFWCPHCQREKKMFGAAVTLLPYVECSTPDASNQTQICKDNNITGYPTWIFADGSRLSGEISLKTLSEKTGCALPS